MLSVARELGWQSVQVVRSDDDQCPNANNEATLSLVKTVGPVHLRSSQYPFTHTFQELYKTSHKDQKASVVRSIVSTVRSMDPPGRFLTKDRALGYYIDVGDAKAIHKTAQALRDTSVSNKQDDSPARSASTQSKRPLLDLETSL